MPSRRALSDMLARLVPAKAALAFLGLGPTRPPSCRVRGPAFLA